MLVVVVGVAVAGAVLVTGFAPAPAYLAGGAAVVLSGMLVHRLAGLGLRQLSVPSVWYLSYVVVTAIPAFFVAAEEPSNYVTPYLFAVVVTLITAPLGMLLVNLATGFSRERTRSFLAEPLERTPAGAAQTATYLVYLAVCLALTVAYIIETPVIPLLHLIRHPGSAAVLVTLREESFKLLDSPLVYLYDLNRNVLYPFLIAMTLGYYLISRSTRWLALLVLTSLTGLFYAAASIAKAPVAVLVLVTALFVYLYRGGQVSLRAMLFAGAAVFLFPIAVLFQSLSGLGVSASSVANAILRRLFYAPAEVLYYYFVIVPDVVPYLGGRTIGRVQWVLGGSGINIGNFVFRYMFPERIATGVANTSFLGYLHADFGVVGILAGGVVVGVLVQGLQLWLTSQRKTITTLAAYAFLLWAAWRINYQALPQTLLSGGIIIILLQMDLLRLSEAFFRVTTSRSRGREAHP